MKVLVTDPIHEEGLKLLREYAEVEISTNLKHEELIEKVPEFDAMIVRSATKVKKEVLDAAENLKLIVRAGVGLDNIDLDYAEELGIKVENTPEASSVAVAELTVGLMLSSARSIPKANSSLKEGKWIKSDLDGTELRNKNLGIIGTGRIGLETAKRAKAFEMELLGNDVVENEEFKNLGGQYVELQTLLKKADYITLHVPLNPNTKHMMGKKEFEKMKDSAVIINTARGSILDEDALIKALKEGKIGGACLDSYETKPAERKELTKLDNVTLTPHIGAQTEEAQRDISVMAAKKIDINLLRR